MYEVWLLFRMGCMAFEALERQGRIQLARDDLDAAAAVVADLELADKPLEFYVLHTLSDLQYGLAQA